jgi:hypothetical protein
MYFVFLLYFQKNVMNISSVNEKGIDPPFVQNLSLIQAY